MVYAYCKNELEAERDKIEIVKDTPDWINNENIKAGNIKYSGNLKKM